MRRFVLASVMLFASFSAGSAEGAQRLIVRNDLALNLSLNLNVISVELDLQVKISGPLATSAPPAGLWDRTPNNYFGSTVWNGYAVQPASSIIRLRDTQSQLGL